MVVEEIRIDREIEERKKREVQRNKEEAFEFKKTINMCKQFNKEAVKQNSNYRMSIRHKYAHLIKKEKILRFFNNEIILKQMFYHKDKDTFKFIHSLTSAQFNDIQSIIEKIPIKFQIELLDGEVPAKYRIIEGLEEDN